MFCSRMRCDPMQNGKNQQQNNWQFSAILGSAFLAIFVLCQAFFIFYQSEDVLVTIWLMTSSFINSTCFLLTIIRSRFLKILQLFKWMAQNPTMIFTSLVWIIPHRNSGCMGFNGLEATSLVSDRCW
jgi:hypothetical protein